MILPLLCQTFLSKTVQPTSSSLAAGSRRRRWCSWSRASRGAKAQVFRYCLNLNFREVYKGYDDIFALMHDEVQLAKVPPHREPHKRHTQWLPPNPMKQIFVTTSTAGPDLRQHLREGGPT